MESIRSNARIGFGSFSYGIFLNRICAINRHERCQWGADHLRRCSRDRLTFGARVTKAQSWLGTRVAIAGSHARVWLSGQFLPDYWPDFCRVMDCGDFGRPQGRGGQGCFAGFANPRCLIDSPP